MVQNKVKLGVMLAIGYIYPLPIYMVGGNPPLRWPSGSYSSCCCNRLPPLKCLITRCAPYAPGAQQGENWENVNLRLYMPIPYVSVWGQPPLKMALR